MDNNQFTIRQAREEDIDLIYNFIKEFARYEKMEDLVVTNPDMLRQSIFEEEYAHVLIGEEDGEPIGFAIYFFNFSTFEGRPGLYLEDVYVREEYRNKGYGKAFLKRLAEIAVENNAKRFEWVCLDWNTSAIDFYKSLGAEDQDQWTIYRIDGKELEDMGRK